jgi:hypothetical protein
VDGQRKWYPENKGEHKRENMKGRAQAKKITKTAKVRVLYSNATDLRKKKEVWDFIRQFDIVELGETWVEERSWEKIEKLLQMGMSMGKTRKEKMKSGGAEFWKFLELIF